MKHFNYSRNWINLLVVLCMGLGLGARAQTTTSVEYDLEPNAAGDSLRILLKRTGAENFTGLISSITYTLRWPATSPATLGAGTQFCPGGGNQQPYFAEPQVQGGFQYQIYVAIGTALMSTACPDQNIIADQWTWIHSIKINNNEGQCTLFEIADDDFTVAQGGDPYVALDLDEFLVPIISPAYIGDPNGACTPDCFGLPGGSAQEDACGVCYELGPADPFWNTTCADCNGDPNGTAFVDDCGVCVGGNTGMDPCETDCAGVPGGSAFLDNCGVCVGGTTGFDPCVADCNGDFGGTAFIDDCGDCVGGNTGELACVADCNGDFGGTAFLDNCGDCVGGNTGMDACETDCAGVPGGSAFLDNCGVCVGGTTGFDPCVADCNGDFGGTAFLDNCGDCVGGNTGEEACVQDCNGDFGGTAFLDNCGDCVGGNTGMDACETDCAGVPGGSAFLDNCGVCVGGTTGLDPCVADCNGDLGGTAFLDNCGECVGGNTGEEACVQDCNGDFGGTAFLDNCGDCVGGNTGMDPCETDCAGVPGGSAFLDNCGVCVGGTTGFDPCVADCNGDFGGTAFLDNCGDCVGGNTGELACVADCNGDFGGTAFLDNCGDCVGGNTGMDPCETDCAGVPGGSAFLDNCGVCVGGTTGFDPCVADCNGDFGGTAFVDNCGVCVGGNTGMDPCETDCAGVPGGSAFLDNCGICVGGNTGEEACEQDCLGVWGGTAMPGTSCDPGPGFENGLWNSECVCVGEPTDPGCNLSIVVEWGCVGESNGWAVVDQIIGATAPTEILWSTGETVQFIVGLSSTDHWVMVTDANGCTAKEVFTVDCEKDEEPCQLRTQTQGGWGAPANGNNPGVYRDANFAAAFPAGLIIGCTNTLTLTSAQAVQQFLPSGGQPQQLSTSLVNPTNYNNVLAGQLVALTLSVGFDSYDPDFGTGGSLANAEINTGLFQGWTVQQLLDEANSFIGGCGSSYTAAQLNNALNLVNNNFVDGTTNNGNVDCGEASPKRDQLDAEATMSLLAYPVPANNILNVDMVFEVGGDIAIRMMDATGRVVMDHASEAYESGEQRTIVLNVNNLASGTYLLGILRDGMMLQTERVIVSH